MKWKQTAVIALLLTLVMTWPAPRYLTSRLIGNNIDNWIFYWNNWWIEEAGESDEKWHFTNYLFYPEGTSLVTHSHSILNSLLAWPLQEIWDGVDAYNIVLLLGLWFGFMGMALLVYDLTQNQIAAWGAAFVFTFAPYHLTQALAHTHLGSIHMWPWAAWSCYRLWQTGEWRYVGWLGLFAAATLWSGLQLALLLALWLAVYVLWELFQGKSWRVAGQCVLAGGLAFLLCLPLLWPIGREWRTLPDSASTFDESDTKQTDLLAYVVPPPYNPWVGEMVQPIYERFAANQAAMPYIGLTVLLLAGMGVCYGWSSGGENGRYLLLTLLGLLLALGPALRFNGHTYEAVPLPYDWLVALFPFSAIRAPDRFNLLMVLSIAPLVGLGLSHIKRPWLLALGAIGLVAEYAIWPLPMWQNIPPASPFISQLGQSEERMAILDYPMGYTISKLWLYYQTLHQKPIIEGHVSRYAPDTYDTIAENAVLQTLYQAGDRPQYLPTDTLLATSIPLGIGLRQLEEMGVRYIVRHLSYESATQAAYFNQQLPLIPHYRDEVIWAYDLEQPRQGSTTFSLSPNVRLLEAHAQVVAGQLAVNVLAQRTGNGRDTCYVQLGEITVLLPLFDPAFIWQVGDLDWLTVQVALPPDGPHQWHIQCQDRYTAPQLLSLTPYPHLHRAVTQFAWQGGIRLQAYDWWIDDAQLHVAFHWQTDTPIEADYKLFVHLLDEAGKLVAQSDTMPCQWSCPTSIWLPGQWIADETTLDIWGLPAGRYDIVVGFYDETTGERLLVEGGVETADFANLSTPSGHPVTIGEEGGEDSQANE